MQHVDHPCALCHSFYGRTAYASMVSLYVTCWGWFVFTPILSDSPTSPNSDFKITKNELVDFYHHQFVTLKLGVAAFYQMETKDDELLIITKFLFPTEVESSFPQIQVLVQPRYLAADHYWLLVPGGKKTRNFRPKWAVKWTWLIIKKPLILEDSQDTSIIHVCRIKSADPSRRDWQISYAESKRCRSILILAQNPKSEIQNPKSKIQTGPFGAATKRTKTKLIQNPKSEIQNPKSKFQNPKSKIRNPKSKIQNPKSEIQNPKSKIQTGRLEFGFWICSGRDRGRWPCSKWRCMAVLATWIWPSWRRTSLQPKGCRLDSRHERPKLGTDFRRRGFAGNRGSISSPVFWGKLGPNFRRNLGWLRAAPTMRVRAKDVNITRFSCKPSKYT